MENKLSHLEHSQMLEEAKDTDREIAETEQLIAEIRAELAELKKEREEAVDDNEFATEHGYTLTDVTKIDLWIQEAEENLAFFEEIKISFKNIKAKFVELHKKGQDILSQDTSKKRLN